MRVLICGGGIGGLTLAWWLHRRGFSPVVAERAREFKRSGYPLGMMGRSVELLGELGLLERLERKSVRELPHTFIDRRGKVLRRLDVSRYTEPSLGNLVLNRSDLHLTIFEAVRELVEIRLGLGVAGVEQPGDGGVRVSFDDGTREEWDLIVGADGVHSTVRRAVFARRFERRSGVAFMAFAAPCGDFGFRPDYQLLMPGRMASVGPFGTDEIGAFFLFRSGPATRLPPKERKRKLIEVFEDAPQLVTDTIETIPDPGIIFHDEVSQVVMPRWSEGRVVLVGDAAHALSLMSGHGASMAIVGARILGEELSRAPNHKEAFAAYESRLRPGVERLQRQALRKTRTAVPTSRFQVAAINFLVRHAPDRLIERVLASGAKKPL